MISYKNLRSLVETLHVYLSATYRIGISTGTPDEGVENFEFRNDGNRSYVRFSSHKYMAQEEFCAVQAYPQA